MDRIATGMTWYEGPICGSPGIGAVQAWFTVKVHPQVDGKLENVLFTEERLAEVVTRPSIAGRNPSCLQDQRPCILNVGLSGPGGADRSEAGDRADLRGRSGTECLSILSYVGNANFNDLRIMSR